MAPKKTSYPKQDIRVLLLEGISPRRGGDVPRGRLQQIDPRQVAAGGRAEAAIADAHFVGIRSRTQLTAACWPHAKRLLAVGCFCIGTNQVDLEAAELAGIPVFNAPYSNTRSVAELVLAEAIMLLRGIPQKNRRSAIAAAGASPPRAATRCAARRWASSATATSAPRSACWPRRWACT
jgi:D-3-phosphoglycerate dehydrogenase